MYLTPTSTLDMLFHIKQKPYIHCECIFLITQLPTYIDQSFGLVTVSCVNHFTDGLCTLEGLGILRHLSSNAFAAFLLLSFSKMLFVSFTALYWIWVKILNRNGTQSSSPLMCTMIQLCTCTVKTAYHLQVLIFVWDCCS